MVTKIGEGVGYINMGSYGTTLFKALEIIIKIFFNQKKSELYVELIVWTSSLNKTKLKNI